MATPPAAVRCCQCWIGASHSAWISLGWTRSLAAVGMASLICCLYSSSGSLSATNWFFEFPLPDFPPFPPPFPCWLCIFLFLSLGERDQVVWCHREANCTKQVNIVRHMLKNLFFTVLLFFRQAYLRPPMNFAFRNLALRRPECRLWFKELAIAHIWSMACWLHRANRLTIRLSRRKSVIWKSALHMKNISLIWRAKNC